MQIVFCSFLQCGAGGAPIGAKVNTETGRNGLDDSRISSSGHCFQFHGCEDCRIAGEAAFGKVLPLGIQADGLVDIVPMPQPGTPGRTRSARDAAGARGRRFVAATTGEKGKARCDRGLRGGNGGNPSRSRHRFGVRRDRAPGEHPQGNQMQRGEVDWADLVPRSGSELSGVQWR